MTTPKGIEIGRVWQPKRGRGHDPVTIRMIYRPDRACLVTGPCGRRVMPWRELRKGYRPTDGSDVALATGDLTVPTTLF